MIRGLSKDGLVRLHEALARHVESEQLPGLVALVSVDGDTHTEAIGNIAFGDGTPMRSDSLFRIASLSKPVVAAAAMQLVDEGSLQLDDPVDELLPELADRRVLSSLESVLSDTVPAQRPITLSDLLTFKFGFGTILAPPDTYPIQTAEKELGLMTLGPPWPPPDFSSDEWIKRFSTLPLMFQPGEQWLYNTGLQILGILLERQSGSSLGALLTERIFDPLEMKYTGFFFPASGRERQTTAYAPNPESGELSVWDGVEESYWNEPPVFENAAGWLVSTMDDFWAFVQMMLSGGKVKGDNILSAGSIELMTRDHLTRRQRIASHIFLGDHSGWGLGMAVPAAGVETPGIPRGFGWDGGTGTTWRSDPSTGLTGIILTQRAMTSPQPPQLFLDFWEAAYGALIET
jgi:CubicO group peptidase (beta-lactamase class C family)